VANKATVDIRPEAPEDWPATAPVRHIFFSQIGNGHPRFYQRFGCRPAAEFGLTSVYSGEDAVTLVRSLRAENHEKNEELLEHIEKELPAASGTVQWNLNWCEPQIGIADESLRRRCIALGERLDLYKDYPVAKGCTSPYLPIWIGSVVAKK
jgi:hypothetical protein